MLTLKRSGSPLTRPRTGITSTLALSLLVSRSPSPSSRLSPPRAPVTTPPLGDETARAITVLVRAFPRGLWGATLGGVAHPGPDVTEDAFKEGVLRFLTKFPPTSSEAAAVRNFAKMASSLEFQADFRTSLDQRTKNNELGSLIELHPEVSSEQIE